MSEWKPGDRLNIDGLPFRVVDGHKKDRWAGDMRVEWRTPDGYWRPVSMAASFMLANFHYVVENGLYPPPAEGGEYFVRNVTEAARGDWRVVAERLTTQRRAREGRDAGIVSASGGLVLVPQCLAPSPDSAERCRHAPGHEGPHRSESWAWPQEKAS